MRSLLVAALAALASSACTHSGMVAVQLTDAPSDLSNATQVLVTVADVRVHNDSDGAVPPAEGDVAGAQADGADKAGWIVLCTPNVTYDLMKLQNGATAPLCPATETIAGHLSQMRLGVTAAQIMWNDGSSTVLKVPSGSTSGLKIDIDRTVTAGQTTTLTLDFVASDSIVNQGNGNYSLKPVLRLK
jgi:hypothetical protein